MLYRLSFSSHFDLNSFKVSIHCPNVYWYWLTLGFCSGIQCLFFLLSFLRERFMSNTYLLSAEGYFAFHLFKDDKAKHNGVLSSMWTIYTRLRKFSGLVSKVEINIYQVFLESPAITSRIYWKGTSFWSYKLYEKDKKEANNIIYSDIETKSPAWFHIA